jgi:hypothetical protein
LVRRAALGLPRPLMAVPLCRTERLALSMSGPWVNSQVTSNPEVIPRG